MRTIVPGDFVLVDEFSEPLAKCFVLRPIQPLMFLAAVVYGLALFTKKITVDVTVPAFLDNATERVHILTRRFTHDEPRNENDRMVG